MKEKVFIVIPTIRNLNFLNEWKEQFQDCHLIIVEDNPEKTVIIPQTLRQSLKHYCWQDVCGDFGKDEWIFSRRNSGIRSYGFWKAYKDGADVIITLDDDCYPAEPDFVKKHLDNLSVKAPEAWFPTFPHPDYLYTRGFPYGVREKYPAMVSHGLWSNKMDLDAKTQIRTGDVNIPAYPPIRQFIPFGYFFPMSSMNLAFRREVTPLMYFPLMGEDPAGKKWGYDRYDDIWAGIFVKKVCDYLGWAVVNGSPFVEHRKASDPKINLIKEAAGMRENEKLWKAMSSMAPAGDNSLTVAQSLIAEFGKLPNSEYFQTNLKATRKWLRLFV